MYIIWKQQLNDIDKINYNKNILNNKHSYYLLIISYNI